MEFDPTSYTNNENAGTVRLVIVKSGNSTNDIIVLFNTRNGSATGILNANNGHTWDPPFVLCREIIIISYREYIYWIVFFQSVLHRLIYSLLDAKPVVQSLGVYKSST